MIAMTIMMILINVAILIIAIAVIMNIFNVLCLYTIICNNNSRKMIYMLYNLCPFHVRYIYIIIFFFFYFLLFITLYIPSDFQKGEGNSSKDFKKTKSRKSVVEVVQSFVGTNQNIVVCLASIYLSWWGG